MDSNKARHCKTCPQPSRSVPFSNHLSRGTHPCIETLHCLLAHHNHHDMSALDQHRLCLDRLHPLSCCLPPVPHSLAHGSQRLQAGRGRKVTALAPGPRAVIGRLDPDRRWRCWCCLCPYSFTALLHACATPGKWQSWPGMPISRQACWLLITPCPGARLQHAKQHSTMQAACCMMLAAACALCRPAA